MTLDLKNLRELCDAATDKKWYASDKFSEDYYHWGYSIGTDKPNDSDIVFYCIEDKANASFIAATDPPTVRALIDEIEGHQEAYEDHKRLVREIDVIINGDGAAQQASLCDVVGCIRAVVAENARLNSELTLMSEQSIAHHNARQDEIMSLRECINIAITKRGTFPSHNTHDSADAALRDMEQWLAESDEMVRRGIRKKIEIVDINDTFLYHYPHDYISVIQMPIGDE